MNKSNKTTFGKTGVLQISRLLLVSVISLTTSISSVSQARAQIIETGTTLAAIGKIRSEIQGIIDQASNRADYLTFRAGTELRNTIDSWEKANRSLLDVAFNKLSTAQQNLFREIDTQTSRLRHDVATAAEVALKISELWNQTVSDAEFWQNEPAFFRISSSVIAPVGSASVNLIVRGINIDKANPTLTVSEPQIMAERAFLSKQEVHFRIKRGALGFDPVRSRVLKARLTLTRPGSLLRSADKREFPVALMLLPVELGRIEVKAIVSTIVREPKSREREFAFSSNDGCEIQNQGPSDGYKVNVDTIRPFARPHPQAGQSINLGFVKVKFPKNATLPAEWGRGGSWRLESSSANGFSVKLCAKRWYGPGLDTGPGNKHVYMKWEEYKERNESQTIPIAIPPPIWCRKVDLE